MTGSPLPHEDMLDLVAVMALGSLSAAEQRTVTLHLAGCEECRAEFVALRPVADLVGTTADVPVDAERTERMRARLFAEIVPRQRRYLTWTMGLVAAASIIFALGSTVQNVGLRADLATRTRTIGELDRRVANETRARTEDRLTVADLVAADARHYAVHGGEVLVRSDRVYVAMRALPPLPRGKVYQAWTVAKGQRLPSPSVTFVPTKNGIDVVRLPADGTKLAAVALSVEPFGGSRKPTGKPTFLRPLQ